MKKSKFIKLKIQVQTNRGQLKLYIKQAKENTINDAAKDITKLGQGGRTL